MLPTSRTNTASLLKRSAPSNQEEQLGVDSPLGKPITGNLYGSLKSRTASTKVLQLLSRYWLSQCLVCPNTSIAEREIVSSLNIHTTLETSHFSETGTPLSGANRKTSIITSPSKERHNGNLTVKR
ncbi:hypothetical protein RRG08_010764 [Elysia crispata]|uniref:Uncharacterized protein n=1 Tax=Elysia crispata TaxID=231223 RepID=A0AAE1A2W6_9GAST|nr:hypothetical protein RRG08_010764 [Elysia crispata]